MDGGFTPMTHCVVSSRCSLVSHILWRVVISFQRPLLRLLQRAQAGHAHPHALWSGQRQTAMPPGPGDSPALHPARGFRDTNLGAGQGDGAVSSPSLCAWLLSHLKLDRISLFFGVWDEQCLVFDDSFDHEVVHAGNSDRVVLLLDVRSPCLHPPVRQSYLSYCLPWWCQVWHPDLTSPERAAIRRFLK